MSHFNEVANEWDTPDKTKLFHTLATETKKYLNYSEKIDVLDFGCGTGLFGFEFLPLAKNLTGIDTSPGMLEVFDKKSSQLPNVESLNINLEENSIDKKFDLIISSMTFHHLNSPLSVLEKLQNSLKSDGKIAIIDLNLEDGTFHPDNEGMGVKHFGFCKNDLQEWATKLGLKLEHSFIHTISKHEKEYKQFLAVYSS